MRIVNVDEKTLKFLLEKYAGTRRKIRLDIIIIRSISGTMIQT